MTFPEAIIQKLEIHPEHVVVEQECDGRQVTAAELLSMVRRLAAAMNDAGLGPGSHVVLILDVSPESLAMYLALYARGCLVIDIRPGYSEAQLQFILDQGVDRVIDQQVVHGMLQTPERPLELLARIDDIAHVAYTSGSTGQPKGCSRTYRALATHWAVNAAMLSPELQEIAARSQRFLLFGTLASIPIQDFSFLSLFNGGTLVIPRIDDAPLFPDVITRLNITASLMNVPRLYQMLDTLRTRHCDLSSLKMLMVSGSPMSDHRLSEAFDRLGPVVYFAYGQTESNCISIITPDEIRQGRYGSVGRPLPHVQVDIREGEVYVRNELAAFEYWQKPELTCEIFQDGWIRTRDCGYIKDGYLYLDGRARDVIMVNALPVYIGPIERVLNNHPEIDEAFVVGVPDDTVGEAVHAFLIAIDQPPDHESIRTTVRQSLGDSSVPKSIHFVSSVPVMPSGKVDKKALAAQYLADD
ncbi:class I adenylate-forming enzyme family protein [Gynuella sp.]|uniref:class I adenylate-forming enzyme family protein n=1 Tax=Gynuella sp. TaxID=2969146 RepID=UPI003D0B1684